MDQPSDLEQVFELNTANAPITGGAYSAPGVDALRPAPGQVSRPLLSSDTADPGSVERQFYQDSKKALQPGEAGSLLSIEKTFFNSDLMNQPIGLDELPSIESVFAQSGSVGLGKSGGILADSADGSSLKGSNPNKPANIGNPRVGEDTTLGTILGGGTPADAEEVLRKQILEAIRTEPTTRLDQSVAIPELYQQVNPAAKLGFPIMQTRPQFPQDFVRGRLALPPSLTIKEGAAILARTDAYSHVDSLDSLKGIYADLYKGKPPRTPEALLETKKLAPDALAVQYSLAGEGVTLPSMQEMYPDAYSAVRSTHNLAPPGSHIDAPSPYQMAPLMAGGVTEIMPDSFAGGAPGSSASKWPINTTGYAVDSNEGA
jgi:hypothetical protein